MGREMRVVAHAEQREQSIKQINTQTKEEGEKQLPTPKFSSSRVAHAPPTVARSVNSTMSKLETQKKTNANTQPFSSPLAAFPHAPQLHSLKLPLLDTPLLVASHPALPLPPLP